MEHVENGTCEQPKICANCEQDFESLACKFTALYKESHSLLHEPRSNYNKYDATVFKQVEHDYSTFNYHPRLPPIFYVYIAIL